MSSMLHNTSSDHRLHRDVHMQKIMSIVCFIISSLASNNITFTACFSFSILRGLFSNKKLISCIISPLSKFPNFKILLSERTLETLKNNKLWYERCKSLIFSLQSLSVSSASLTYMKCNAT